MKRAKRNEILKMLFEEHHRQLAARRQKIHSISERTLGLLMVITGWQVVTDKSLTGGLHWVIISAVIIIAGAACFTIYNNNSVYYKITPVVRKIGMALELFVPNKFLPNESIYPDDWKGFGEKGKLKGFLPHWAVIIAVAVLCIIVTVLKAK